jgi:hypothetical protein
MVFVWLEHHWCTSAPKSVFQLRPKAYSLTNTLCSGCFGHRALATSKGGHGKTAFFRAVGLGCAHVLADAARDLASPTTNPFFACCACTSLASPSSWRNGAKILDRVQGYARPRSSDCATLEGLVVGLVRYAPSPDGVAPSRFPP